MSCVGFLLVLNYFFKILPKIRITGANSIIIFIFYQHCSHINRETDFDAADLLYRSPKK